MESFDPKADNQNDTVSDSEHTTGTVLVGGKSNQSEDRYSTIVGGQQNKIARGKSHYSFYGFNTIGGGIDNKIVGKYCTIGGGYGNSAFNFYSTVCGGEDNTASGGRCSTVCGGFNNTAKGNFSTICGGAENEIVGEMSAIPGGYNLKLGLASFGFSGQDSEQQTDLSNYDQIAAFVDVNLWLYNVQGKASELRLYEPTTDRHGYAKYTAMRSQNMARNVCLVFPPVPPSPGDVLAVERIEESDGVCTVYLQWKSL